MATALARSLEVSVLPVPEGEREEREGREGRGEERGEGEERGRKGEGGRRGGGRGRGEINLTILHTASNLFVHV